jgi:N-acyl-D-aspartate/D-glutamate deacylase
VPADLYGFHDRGRIAVGNRADIVVFDEAAVGPRTTTVRRDLPDGSGRLYAGAEGIASVIVGGAVVASDDRMTDARPGVVVRSGTDTTSTGTG